MDKYIIESRKNFDFIEDYEKNSQNVIEIEALDYLKRRIYNISEFNIYFSEDAVIGLGTELVRLYMEKLKTQEIHLPKANDDYVAEGLGICISPNSADITFLVKNMNIDELLHNTKCNEFEAKKNFKSNIFIEDCKKEKIKEFILNDSIAYGRYDLKDFSLIKINKTSFKIIYLYKCNELHFDINIDEVSIMFS